MRVFLQRHEVIEGSDLRQLAGSVPKPRCRSLRRMPRVQTASNSAYIDHLRKERGLTISSIRVYVLFIRDILNTQGCASPGTWIGRRDRVLLLVATQTGLRNSELTSLRCQDVEFGIGAHVRCLGKGRKMRCTLPATCGSKRDRSLARPRIDRDDPNLLACRHAA